MLCYPMICPLQNFFHVQSKVFRSRVISLQNSAPVLTPEILKVRSVTHELASKAWARAFIKIQLSQKP